MGRGLSELQMDILRELSTVDGWFYWKDKSDFNVSPASLSRALKRLEKRGLIEKAKDRYIAGYEIYSHIVVRLTPEGKLSVDTTHGFIDQ